MNWGFAREVLLKCDQVKQGGSSSAFINNNIESNEGENNQTQLFHEFLFKFSVKCVCVCKVCVCTLDNHKKQSSHYGMQPKKVRKPLLPQREQEYIVQCKRHTHELQYSVESSCVIHGCYNIDTCSLSNFKAESHVFPSLKNLFQGLYR